MNPEDAQWEKIEDALTKLSDFARFVKGRHRGTTMEKDADAAVTAEKEARQAVREIVRMRAGGA